MRTPFDQVGGNRPRFDYTVVRQHTPVQISLDSGATMLCVEIVGDDSVVLLGLTPAGGDMLMRQVADGLARLNEASAGRHERNDS
jgi:hypothetical protein